MNEMKNCDSISCTSRMARSTRAQPSRSPLCGIKFFVEWTLGRKWTLFELVRPPREKKLPKILSWFSIELCGGLPVRKAVNSDAAPHEFLSCCCTNS